MSELLISIIPPIGPSAQDRICIERRGDTTIIAVADGAGGLGGGAAAAELAVKLACAMPAADTQAPRFWIERLMQIDDAIMADPAAGETTLVTAAITRGSLVGAAVGDSVAWLIRDGEASNLTAETQRKPFLGSGAAHPRAFGPITLSSATLLLATDGLWKYAPRDQLIGAAHIAHLPGNIDSILDLARLPSGRLQDDVCAALVRTASSELP